MPVLVSGELPKGVISIPSHSHEVINGLIPKIDLSASRAGESMPIWFAGIGVSKG